MAQEPHVTSPRPAKMVTEPARFGQLSMASNELVGGVLSAGPERLEVQCEDLVEPELEEEVRRVSAMEGTMSKCRARAS